MASTLTAYAPTIIARTIQVLRERLAFMSRLTTDYDMEMTDIGQTLQIPVTAQLTAGDITPANTPPALTDVRMTALNPSHLTDAGWHLSWLGGADAAIRKVGSFCHPEVEDRIRNGLTSDQFLRDGIHVDGVKMRPVDVDESWPKWITEGHAPASWFRPR